MNNPRPFFDTARDIRRGQFLEECADKLQEVIAACATHDKKATLVIEITVAPASRTGGAVKVSDKITAKLPGVERGETILFVTTDNNLATTDPRQKSLNLKPAPNPLPGDLKPVVDTETGELKTVTQ